MPCFISRSELASLAGVTPAAITKACRRELAQACEGQLVDRDHTYVRAYLIRHGVTDPGRNARPMSRDTLQARSAPAPTPPPKPAPAPVTATAPAPPPPPKPAPAQPARTDVAPPDSLLFDVGKLPENLHELLDLSLREIVERHGTETRIIQLLDIRKKIEDIRSKELDNDETEGKLVSRELVQTHVLGAFDAAFRRMLENASKTCAREIYSACKNDMPPESAEATVRGILSRELQVAKTAASKALR
jgi:hypothetical protein